MSQEMREAITRALLIAYGLEIQGYPEILVESNIEHGYALVDAVNHLGEPELWLFCCSDFIRS